MTNEEKLTEFIKNLSNEEAERIISYLRRKE